MYFITRFWGGGTCLRKASADGADTATCLSSFHSLMVRGKNEFCLMSFLHCSRRSCWSCALLDLVGAGSNSLHWTLTLLFLILYRFVNLVAFRLFWSDGHLRSFSMVVTLLVFLWSFRTNLAALLWIFSMFVVWALVKGSQTEAAYSTLGLTSILRPFLWLKCKCFVLMQNFFVWFFK